MIEVMINRSNLIKYAAILTLSVCHIVIVYSQGAVVGYAAGGDWIGKPSYPNYTDFPTAAQLARLTHVVASDIGCNANGTLFTGKLPNSWNGSKNKWIEDLVNRAHNAGVKVSICVGGGEPERTKWRSATSTYLTTFVGNIVSFVEDHKLDGVDIDWEKMTNHTLNDFDQSIALLQALKSALPCKRISIAVPIWHPANYPSHPSPALPSARQIWNIADAIHIMTYDEGVWPSGDWTTHSQASSANAHIYNWASWGASNGNLDKKKLFLGCAFYGWHPAIDANKVSYGGACNNPGDNTGDVQSKINHCHSNGYGGMMIWELGYDANTATTPTLLDAIWVRNNPPHNNGHSIATITTQPTPYTFFAQGNNTSVVLSVAASTNYSCQGYQWYESATNSNKSGTEIIGAKGSNFTVPSGLPGNGKQYYYFCQVNTSVGAIRSNVAMVDVGIPTCIGCQPPPPAPKITGPLSGPSIVCTTGSIFELTNPTGHVVWEIDDPFTATVNPNNLALVTVTKTGWSNSSATLKAKINGTVVDAKSITPCKTEISGPSTVCFDGSSFSAIDLPPCPSGTISWTVTGPFSFSPFENSQYSSIASPTVYRTNSTASIYEPLTMRVNGKVVASKNIGPCLAIFGPSYVCTKGFYRLNPEQSGTWSVDPDTVFSISPSNNGYSATVTTTAMNGQTGTITVVVNGIPHTKEIQTCDTTGIALYREVFLEEYEEYEPCEYYYSFEVERKMEVTIHHHQSGYKHTYLRLVTDPWYPYQGRLVAEAYDSYHVSDDRNLTQACIKTVLYPGTYYLKSTFLPINAIDVSNTLTVIEGRVIPDEPKDPYATPISWYSRYCFYWDSFDESFQFMDTRYVYDFTNDGGYSCEIPYCINWTVPMDVRIYNHESDLSLQQNQSMIWINCSGVSEYGAANIFKRSLSPNEYQIVSTGWCPGEFGGLCLLTTYIEGRPVVGGSIKYPIDLDTLEDNLSVSDVRVPLRYCLEYEDYGSNVLIPSPYYYKFELESIANISISIDKSINDFYLIDEWGNYFYESLQDNDTKLWNDLDAGVYYIVVDADHENEYVELTLTHEGSGNRGNHQSSPRNEKKNSSSLSSYIFAYPNPTGNILNIEIDAEAAMQEQSSSLLEKSGTGVVYDIRLYDGLGNLLRRATTKGGTVQFNVGNLPYGAYYLHVYDGVSEKPVMRQIIVER